MQANHTEHLFTMRIHKYSQTSKFMDKKHYTNKPFALSVSRYLNE